MRRLGATLGAVLLILGSALLGEQGFLAVKAAIAERLIGKAFASHLVDGAVHRPWRWADTHPVARLSVPRLGVERIVLAGASGSSLAFGPGHISGTALPNGEGNSALAGHRDTWFAFLRELRRGDEILLETRERSRRYVVDSLWVRSMWDGEVLAPTTGAQLTLITCYPFDSLRRGTERYVVVARITEVDAPGDGPACAATGARREAPGPAAGSPRRDHRTPRAA